MKAVEVTGAWRFEAGEAVPEWLLGQEPTRAGAVRAALTFEVACDVIEIDGRYVIAPARREPVAVLRLSRSGGLKLSAPGRSVQLVTDWNHIAGLDEGVP